MNSKYDSCGLINKNIRRAQAKYYQLKKKKKTFSVQRSLVEKNIIQHNFIHIKNQIHCLHLFC